MHNINRPATLLKLALSLPSTPGNERTTTKSEPDRNGCGGESGCKSYNGASNAEGR